MNQQSSNYTPYPPPPPQQGVAYAYPTNTYSPYPPYTAQQQLPGLQQQQQPYFRAFDHGVQQQIPLQQQQNLVQQQQQQQPRRQQQIQNAQHVPQAQMQQSSIGIGIAPPGSGPPPAQEDLEDQLRTALQNSNDQTDNEHNSEAGEDDPNNAEGGEPEDEGAIFNLPPPPEGNYPSVEDLESTVHAWTLEHGYEVVRRASKKNANGVIYKRYYHCSKHGKLANTGKLTAATRQRANRKTNRQNCPMSMAVVAVDPSNPEGEWQIRHRKTHHNHGPMEAVTLAGHRRRARMGGVEKAVDGLFAIGTPTSQVVQFLQRTNPEGLFTRTDVANMKLKYKKFGTCVHLKDQFARDPDRALGLPSACLRCREKKVRCNSVRPQCQNCQLANEQCMYDHEPGQAAMFNDTQGGADGQEDPGMMGDDGSPLLQTTPTTSGRRKQPRTDLGVRRAAAEQILQDLQSFQNEHVKPKRLDLNSSSVEILAHSSCGNGDSYKAIPRLNGITDWQGWSEAFLEASLKENTESTLLGEKTEPVRPTALESGGEVEVEDWNEWVKQSAIFTRRNGLLLASLWGTVGPSFRTRISGFKRASQAWRAVEEMCCPRGSDSAFRLFDEVHSITLESCGGDISDYVTRMETAWTAFGRLRQSQVFTGGRQTPSSGQMARGVNYHTPASSTPGLGSAAGVGLGGTGMDLLPEEALCFLFLRGLGEGWRRWVEVLCQTSNLGGFGTGTKVGWREVVKRVVEADAGGTGGGR
ncbi:hypothetical protein LTR27_012722 [Elasticomyces elasticus]|nr:hypothetical protein LTR27_012722 [Elasticomyces elasticus]